MKLKIFKQIACALVAVVAGIGIGVAIMWGGRSASAAVESHSHPLVYNMGESATCEHAGHYAYYECEECHKFYADRYGREEIAEADLIIPQTGHQLKLVAQKNATCGEAGVYQHYECKFCHKKFWDKDGKNPVIDGEEMIAKAAHATIEWVDEEDATCTQEGWHGHYECLFCHEMFHDKAGKEPYPTAYIGYKHNLIWKSGVAATCTSEGTKPHYYCETCGKCFEDEAGQHEITDLTIAKLPHELRGYQPEVLPDCEHDGHPAYYTCIDCGKCFYADDTSKEFDANHLEAKYKKREHNYVESLVNETPYRLMSKTGDFDFNNVTCYKICSVCGDKVESRPIIGYAVINPNHSNSSKVAVSYVGKDMANVGEVVDYEKYTINESALNSNHQITIQIVLPENYTANSVLNLGDKTTMSLDEQPLVKYMNMTVDLSDGEVVWQFDWDNDGFAEQIIHVVAL